ncbi:DUF4345 family protein [bacterium]|nr:DUF4345 family protein [bacterium]
MLLSIWLLLNALIYLVLGFLFIFQFDTITGNLGILAETGSAAIELMTVYGGLEAGFGILFSTALVVRKIRYFALQVLTFSYGSFAVGRLIGILQVDVSETLTWWLLLFEMAGFVISGILLKKSVQHPGVN